MIRYLHRVPFSLFLQRRCAHVRAARLFVLVIVVPCLAIIWNGASDSATGTPGIELLRSISRQPFLSPMKQQECKTMRIRDRGLVWAIGTGRIGCRRRMPGGSVARRGLLPPPRLPCTSRCRFGSHGPKIENPRFISADDVRTDPRAGHATPRAVGAVGAVFCRA